VKKNSLLMAALLSLGLTTANAQIGLVYDFPVSGATVPAGPVILSGRTLYGTTLEGGAHSKGCIYSVDTNGTGYKDLYDFKNVFGPEGSLVLSGSTLFGVTRAGLSDSGCIFAIDTDGSGYTDLHDFMGPDGESPYGGLTLSGSVLYGMTLNGGAHHRGVIFSINTNGTGYTDMFNLDATTGCNPLGPLTLENGLLYGETVSGGANAAGDVFCIKPNGTGFRDLYDFNPNSIYGNDGYLTPLRNKLYGMVNQGGVGASGGIFSIDTNGGGFTDVYEFPGYFVDDAGGLTLVGNLFFGTNGDGGSNMTGDGAIFSIDTAGSGFRELYDFNGTYGAGLNGSLVYSKDKLYGTAEGGGSQNFGTVFKYDTTVIATGVNELIAKSEEVRIYPNPSNGMFNLTISNYELGINNTVEIYNMLGEKVYSNYQITKSSNYQIDLSSQPAGLYLYRVITQNGELAGEGKIEIQK